MILVITSFLLFKASKYIYSSIIVKTYCILFCLNRQVRSIIIRSVHDVQDVMECLARVKRCFCRVRRYVYAAMSNNEIMTQLQSLGDTQLRSLSLWLVPCGAFHYAKDSGNFSRMERSISVIFRITSGGGPLTVVHSEYFNQKLLFHFDEPVHCPSSLH